MQDDLPYMDADIYRRLLPVIFYCLENQIVDSWTAFRMTSFLRAPAFQFKRETYRDFSIFFELQAESYCKAGWVAPVLEKLSKEELRLASIVVGRLLVEPSGPVTWFGMKEDLSIFVLNYFFKDGLQN